MNSARRSALSLVAAPLVTVLLMTPGTSSAYQPPGRTDRVSVGTGELQGAKDAADVAVSADGRFVAFRSRADNIVPGDSNGTSDVFVRDRLTRRTEIVSISTDGRQVVGASSSPAITADGRYVFFVADGTLDPSVPPAVGLDVYVRDLMTKTTEVVSVDAEGRHGLVNSFRPAITPDGRFVAFPSGVPFAPEDDNGADDIYVKDRLTGEVRLGSRRADGGVPRTWSSNPSISADGTKVLFSTEDSSVVPGDTNGATNSWNGRDLFLHDFTDGSTRRVSVASDGSQANGPSILAALSADGRVVVFESQASNIVPNDTNATYDVFRHELDTGRVTRVSVFSDGAESQGASRFDGTISDDGRFIGFEAEGPLLRPERPDADPVGLESPTKHAYLHDAATLQTERISLSVSGTPAVYGGRDVSVSSSGRFVGFVSGSGDLVHDDTNECGPLYPEPYCAIDVFVRDTGPAFGVGELVARRNGAGVSLDGWVRARTAGAVSATDASGDAPVPFGDLVGAAVTARPEEEDVVAILDVSALPSSRSPAGGVPGYGGWSAFVECLKCFPPGVAASPLTYGVTLTAGGARYEVRVAEPAGLRGAVRAEVHRCVETCEQVGSADASIGSAGDRIVIAIPQALLPETALQASAFVATAAGAAVLDEVSLGTLSGDRPTLEVGVAPAGQMPAALVPATIADGVFGVTVPAGAGDTEAVARLCGGSGCATARAPIAVS